MQFLSKICEQARVHVVTLNFLLNNSINTMMKVANSICTKYIIEGW